MSQNNVSATIAAPEALTQMRGNPPKLDKIEGLGDSGWKLTTNVEHPHSHLITECYTFVLEIRMGLSAADEEFTLKVFDAESVGFPTILLETTEAWNENRQLVWEMEGPEAACEWDKTHEVDGDYPFARLARKFLTRRWEAVKELVFLPW